MAKMAIGQQFAGNYTLPPLARIFHEFPHLNGTLHFVNNTFDPHSEIYLESLVILGSVPAALLILTLLILLVYLITRCCDRKPRHRRSIAVLKCFLAIFSLVCSAAVAVGLWGNDDVHNAYDDFIKAVQPLNKDIEQFKNQSFLLQDLLKSKLQPDLDSLRDQFDAPASNKTAVEELLRSLARMQANATTALNKSLEIRKPLAGVSLGPAIELAKLVETFRWPVTMALLSALLILCVVLLVGVARHSRCALITFSVFGLFAVIVSWLTASVYLASSVALGDLCVSPDGYLGRSAPSPFATDVFTYYAHCDSTRKNPFTYMLGDMKKATDEMRRTLDLVKQIALAIFDDANLQTRLTGVLNDVNAIDSKIASLTSVLDCKSIHQYYVKVANALCHTGLFGLTLMLLSSVAAGFLFTILVWMDSHTWIYIRKRNDYHQVNEHDPYLPAPQASQAIAARTLRGQGSYPPTAPPLNTNAHGNHTIKQPLLLTPPPPSYATATARARQMHDSMSKGGGLNGSGIGDHKPSQHNQSSGRSDHRAGLGDQPGQYATLSKQCKTLESNDFY
ncbi:protein tweety [Phymastichus coffea]|uniref:protein tweety n=1 Tax=Phymastichus coffea TaxID=108790 RepID=UPI00273AD4B1|nr:protein tweety [Phymastichus coffea]XP_058805740.1 protein tweety [Phymastichus coffea]